MDYVKINVEVLKGLSDSTSKTCGFNAGDYVFVTTDGFVGYFIPNEWVYFDRAKLREISNKLFNLDDYFDGEKIKAAEIEKTNILLNEYGNKQFISKFKARVDATSETGASNTWNVYVDEKFLKPLSKEYGNVRYFQLSKEGANMSLMPILAAKYWSDKRGEKPQFMPLMYILPIRRVEDEDE